MAKNTMPMMPSSGGGVGKKLIGVLLGLAVLTLIVKQPNTAAELATGLFTTLGGAVDSVSTFLTAVLR